MRRLGRVLSVVTAGLALLATAPPSTAWRELHGADPTVDHTGPVVAAAALLAWALAAWLAMTVLVTAAGRLPGMAGRLAGAGARRIAPAAVRRAVELALGLTVAAGGLGAVPASAAPGPDAAPASATDASTTRPGLDWPRGAGPAGTASTGGEAAESVLVRPGDSLWRLAAQQLQAAGAPALSDAQIAQAWPSWWSANRDLVGDDPDLIRPGMRLSPPADLPSPS